jgi:hypothetical protein
MKAVSAPVIVQRIEDVSHDGMDRGRLPDWQAEYPKAREGKSL